MILSMILSKWRKRVSSIAVGSADGDGGRDDDGRVGGGGSGGDGMEGFFSAMTWLIHNQWGVGLLTTDKGAKMNFKHH